MKIEEPLPDFLAAPSKEFENECASMVVTNR
jgi:hypothetical protein